MRFQGFAAELSVDVCSLMYAVDSNFLLLLDGEARGLSYGVKPKNMVCHGLPSSATDERLS